jgi:hypothetical protein
MSRPSKKGEPPPTHSSLMGAGAIKLEQDKEFLKHCSIDIGRNDANEQGRHFNSINTIIYRC